ncbi:hypothetical protein CEXT_755951, partial [Caerostris extrusa]
SIAVHSSSYRSRSTMGPSKKQRWLIICGPLREEPVTFAESSAALSDQSRRNRFRIVSNPIIAARHRNSSRFGQFCHAPFPPAFLSFMRDVVEKQRQCHWGGE